MSRFNYQYKLSYIYALVDPRTEEVRYIGKTIDLARRTAETVRQAKKDKTYKANWIKNLLKENLKPLCIILDEVEFREESFWEKHYISLYRSWGFKLTNATSGGEGTVGLKRTVETRAKMSKPKTLDGKKVLEWLFEHKAVRFSCLPEAYNKCRRNTNIKWSLETFRKLVKKTNLIVVDQKHVRSTQRVLQYTIDNKLVKEWVDIKQVALHYETNFSTIAAACSKLGSSSYGFKWCYKKDQELLKTQCCAVKSKIIYQYDEKEKLVRKWYSIKEAALSINSTQKQLSSFLFRSKNTSQHYKGFIWKYNELSTTIPV